MKKFFTKKYWQVKYANLSMFMFRWCYDWKSTIKSIIVGFIVLPIVLSIAIPFAILSKIEEFLREIGFPWVYEKFHLHLEINPLWYKMTYQDKLDRWKTWD